uniref:Uncharacterized protein n=1 Tax=Theropithecus gelada TaxID=9565 RepID=A0A8D2K4I6_THEGE
MSASCHFIICRFSDQRGGNTGKLYINKGLALNIPKEQSKVSSSCASFLVTIIDWAPCLPRAHDKQLDPVSTPEPEWTVCSIQLLPASQLRGTCAKRPSIPFHLE